MKLTPPHISSHLIAMIGGAFCVSAGAAFIKMAGSRLPVMEVVFARSLFMLFYCLLGIRRAGVSVTGHDKRFLFLRGILGFGAYVTIFYAVIHMPLADALVIVYSFPLIVPFMAAAFLGERLESRVVLCTLLGAAGMILVARPEALFGGTSTISALAVTAAVGAALFSSVSVICIRRLTSTEHPLVIVFYAAAISTLGTLLIDGWNWIIPNWTEMLILLCVGVSMSIGQHFITVAFSKSSTGRTSVLFYFQVLMGAILGYLLFDEMPGMSTYAGAALILGAATLIGIRKTSRG